MLFGSILSKAVSNFDVGNNCLQSYSLCPPTLGRLVPLGDRRHLTVPARVPDCHYPGSQHQLGKNTEEQDQSATTHILNAPH